MAHETLMHLLVIAPLCIGCLLMAVAFLTAEEGE